METNADKLNEMFIALIERMFQIDVLLTAVIITGTLILAGVFMFIVWRVLFG